MRPLLLRPPDEILPVVNDFTGAPLWSAERSTKTSWRWPGVVGLYVLSAMVPASRGSESRSHVDAVPFLEGHDCLLHVRQLTAHTAEIADLAFANERIDVLDLHVEQLLHGLLDLRLGGMGCDPEDHLVALRGKRRLFGNDRRPDDVVVARIVGGHFKRASSASSAALVRTSVFRRSMS